MTDNDILKIDTAQLDKEWIQQPILFHTWSLELASAREAHDEQKAQLDVVRAELDKHFRNKLEKVTEKTVEMEIVKHTRYKTQLSVTRDAKHHIDVCQAMVNALDQKKRALESLVQLLGMDYFAEPRAKSPEDRERMDEATKKATRRKRRKS